jgi:hypothetical protein
MGYLENPVTQQIVTAKVTLTSADLLTPGLVIDVPEYPAVKDYFWVVLNMNGNIVNGSTPYVGTNSIHIQASTAPDVQSRFVGGFLSNVTNTWCNAPINTSSAGIIIFADNDNLQIHNPGTLTVGDNDLILYISAILIKR